MYEEKRFTELSRGGWWYKSWLTYLLINMTGGNIEEPHGNIWKGEKSDGEDRKPQVEKDLPRFS